MTFFAIIGISNDPGTRYTVIRSSLAPWRIRASRAPSSKRMVIKSLKRLTMIEKSRPSALRCPSTIRDMYVSFRAAPAGLDGARRGCLTTTPVFRQPRTRRCQTGALTFRAWSASSAHCISLGARAKARARQFVNQSLRGPRPCGDCCHQPQPLDPQMGENLRPDAIITQVRPKPQFLIGLHGITSGILQGIGPNLIGQANTTPFLVQIEKHAGAFFGNEPQ